MVAPVRLPVTEACWPETVDPVAGARAPAATWARRWTGPLTGDVAAWRAGAAPLAPVRPDAGGVPVPTLATALLAVLVTDPATGLTTGLLPGR